jgi:cytochrome b pre-mRNA-processing protein 3
MLTWLRERGRTGRTASKLYGSIVAHARNPAFFTDLGVPDSLEGRYGVLVVHLWLILDRLKRAPASEGLARALVETFVTDMDDNMREIGVGDLSVPRKVKKAAAGLFDRTREYDAALASGDDAALCAALGRHLAGTDAWPAASRLLTWIRVTRGELTRWSDDRLLAGEIAMPAPETGASAP